MKKKMLFLLLLILQCAAFSQQFDFGKQISWEPKPSLHLVKKQFDSAGAIGILDDRRVEYKEEGKEIVIYTTYHRIVHIKSDRGIEMFNKVYISMHSGAEVTQVKARTIFPDGRIINLDSTKIKEIDEEGNAYKIFAVDGIEKGAEVEYLYTIKRSFALFGSEVFQSASLPYQQVYFTLVAPQHLRFSAKGYNGFTVSSDSLIGEQRIIKGYDADIKELEEEKYAERDQYLKRVDYKLSYNLVRGPEVRLYTWKEFAKKAFSFYTDRTEKEDKALTGLLSQVKLDAGATEVQKIQALEDYIKTNFNIDKKLIAQGADAIEKIIKTKAANNEGIIKLFAGILDKAGIQYQLVFPSKRSDFPIDEEIENWNRAEDVLFYFQQTGKFIAPYNIALRYPYIPSDFTETKALFLKGTVIGNFKTAIGSFANIPIEPFDQHAENMEADIRFDESLDTLIISAKQILKGYPAADYRPIYVFLPKDKQDEASKEIIKAVGKSTAISNIKILNTKLTDCADNKPLVISADIKSTELLENAGNKILLKLGEIIGPQVEMYQEKPRSLPVEIPFPHVLQRKIIFHIPAGYRVKNLSDLHFDISYKENDAVTMGFTTTYSADDTTVNLFIDEVYKKVRYPIEQFEDFKKVINASADFNKVVLVLEKK